MKCAAKGCTNYTRSVYVISGATSDGTAFRLEYCTRRHMRQALKELVG